MKMGPLKMNPKIANMKGKVLLNFLEERGGSRTSNVIFKYTAILVGTKLELCIAS